MEFKQLLTKENMIEGLKITGRIGKRIVIKGTQALILEGATTVLKTSFEGGLEDVKKLKLDDFIGKDEPKEPKKKMKLFSKKNKKNEAEEILDEVEDIIKDKHDDKVETFEGEIVSNK